jgi:hypothetical protein
MLKVYVWEGVFEDWDYSVPLMTIAKTRKKATKNLKKNIKTHVRELKRKLGDSISIEYLSEMKRMINFSKENKPIKIPIEKFVEYQINSIMFIGE